MDILVSNIDFDLDDECFDLDNECVELPTEMVITVPEGLNAEESLQFISDKISEDTGFCHYGFKTSPEIE